MNQDEIIKYVIWVVLFMIALFGIYFLMKKLGAL
jgi:hypothetical protein